MRRVELIIDMSRKQTGNTRYDNDSGVPQDVFVQMLNNAQDELLKQVINLKTKFLRKSVTVPVVPGQEVYDYPADCYMQHIDTIQWYSSRYGAYYQNLIKAFVKERVTGVPSYPFAYIPYEDGFHLNPPIINGVMDVTYVKQVPRVQKRNGQVNTATIVSDTLTVLHIDPTTPGIDIAEINNYNYLCICGRDGNVKASNIPYDSYSTGVFTLSPFPLNGQTIAVGDYVLIGENCVNIPKWPDICESYLLKFTNYESKYGDSSQWTKEVKDDMANTFESLAGSFATLSDDITGIPLTNLDYIGF